MKHAKSLPSLVVLFLLIVLSTVKLTEGFTLYLYLTVIVLSVIAFSLFSSNNGFVVFLMMALGIGVFHTGVAFYTKITNINQLSVILSYFVVLVAMALIWLIFYIVKSMQKEHKQLQKTVETLKKFEATNQILTKTEFLSRMTLLYTGMKRRNETGYLLLLVINPEKKYIQDALFHTASHVALASIRQEYDLVGKIDHHTLAILLQNTHEAGTTIVMERFEQKVAKELDMTLTPYTLTKQPLDEILYQQWVKGVYAA